MNEAEEALARARRSLGRLEVLLESLDDDASHRRTAAGWSVAGTLVHLAFYDDWVAGRWRRWLANGRFQDLPDDLTELVNAAGARGWNAVSAETAPALARDAGRGVVEVLGQLPAAALQDAVATGRLAMIDRSVHWDPHLDEIESAIRNER